MASDSPTAGTGAAGTDGTDSADGTDATGLQRHLRTTGAVLTVVAGAFVVAAVLSSLGTALLDPFGLTYETPLGRVLISAFQFIGFGAVALAYFSVRDWGLLRVRVPTLRDAGWTVLGLVGLVGLLYASSVVYRYTSLEAAESTLIAFGQGQPVFFLYLVPLTLLLVGPAEELLFRGAVQGTLAREYGPVPGIAAASAVFALIHWSSYTGEGLLVTLSTVLLLGGLLGALYYRTDNVVVPAVAHGLFNAVQFLYEYAAATGLL
jgi:membrane protease YdiL (CAAX protease family)